MQGSVTVSLPHDTPKVSLDHWTTYVSARIHSTGCTVAVTGDDAEQIATWFERCAADVRSKALEQTLTAAALGRVQDHVSTGVDDG